MTEIRKLKQDLVVPQDESVFQNIWNEIDARRAKTRLRPRFRGVYVLGVAAAGVILLVAAMLFLKTGEFEHGSLRMANGETLPRTVTTATTRKFVFSDDSQLTVASQTRLDTLVNSANSMVFALRDGKVRFEITPGGPRKWQVHCGDVLVSVTGTIFEVRRSAKEFSVYVERGEVIVEGNGVPDGVQRLSGKMGLKVRADGDFLQRKKPSATPNLLTDEKNVKTASGIAADSIGQMANRPVNPQLPHPDTAEHGKGVCIKNNCAPPAVHAQPTTLPDWYALASDGEFEKAFASLPDDIFTNARLRAMTPAQLFLLADTARVSGHSVDARLALLQIVEQHSDTPKAGIAAYTLGKIEIDALKNPVAAVHQFETALAYGLPGPLAETAAMRLVHINKDLNKNESLRWAHYYIAQYPNGRYVDSISRIIAELTPDNP